MDGWDEPVFCVFSFSSGNICGLPLFLLYELRSLSCGRASGWDFTWGREETEKEEKSFWMGVLVGKAAVRPR